MMRWELEIYVLSDSGVDKLLRFVSKISVARVFPPPSLQLVPRSNLQLQSLFIVDIIINDIAAGNSLCSLARNVTLCKY